MKVQVDFHMRRVHTRKPRWAYVELSVPGEGGRTKHYRLNPDLNSFHEVLGMPGRITGSKAISLDLLYFAASIYLIDRVLERRLATDLWTRDITVKLPVSCPGCWEKVAKKLDETIGFLTGDIWHISFKKIKGKIFRPPKVRTPETPSESHPARFSHVCLFSGGADSLAGAIDLLARKKTNRVLLVGHHDIPGPKKDQEELFREIANHPNYGGRVKLLQAWLGPGRKRNRAEENSFRSRSLVFFAVGIYAAQNIRADMPLHAPENGLIAINVPLTASRSGSCSTRTMHPFYLKSFMQVLNELGIRSGIINPFRFRTKGECFVRCRNPRLLGKVVTKSVSCSHPSRRKEFNRRAANCGYCVPCLIRRAALHRFRKDEGFEYGFDVCRGERPRSSSATNDLRALLDFLRQNHTASEIESLIDSVADIENVKRYTRVVKRGFEELRIWLTAKAGRDIKQAAGI